MNKIAVIDDAFDIPSIEDILTEDKEDFWDAIGENKDAMGEIIAIAHKEVIGPDDLNEDLIARLWNHRKDLSITKELCENKLFQVTIQRQSQLDPFIKLLEELNCTVITAGRDASLADSDIKLVFLDYRLGPVGSGDVEMAVKAVTRIYSDYPESKPVVILMSAARLDTDNVEDFRKRSKLLSGSFFFVPKDELVDKTSLYLKLWQLVTGLPFGGAIHEFVNALEDSLGAASESLFEGIRKLSLSDYAYIQKLSLQDEGQPMGDYLLWLFGSYFAQALSNSKQVKHHREIIDKLTVDELPLGQIDPSLQLKSFYSSAMFDFNAGPVSSHPRSTADQHDQPYLQLGDIFAKDDPNDDILMVINAQCDLIYSPDTPKWFRQLDLAHFDIFIWPTPKPVFQNDPCSRIDASGFSKTSCWSVLPKNSGLPVEAETEGARRATGVSASTGWVNVKSWGGGTALGIKSMIEGQILRCLL